MRTRPIFPKGKNGFLVKTRLLHICWLVYLASWIFSSIFWSNFHFNKVKLSSSVSKSASYGKFIPSEIPRSTIRKKCISNLECRKSPTIFSNEVLKKVDGQAFKSAEVQKSTREFSHGQPESLCVMEIPTLYLLIFKPCNYHMCTEK